ncbi:MAG: hypothetical protein RIS29_3364 [Bacteroidota bacterium]|jgi:hypothetical protein
MKSIKFLFYFALVAVFFTSCEKEEVKNPTEEVKSTVVTFESVNLDAKGIWNGSDLSGKAVSATSWGMTITNYIGSFQCEGYNFENEYTKEWDSWTGFSCSNNNDTIVAGYTNQYSVYEAAGAAGSKKFAVVYETAGVKASVARNAVSVMMANSTYGFKYMKDGNSGNGPVANAKFSTDDWFKVTAVGFLNKTKTASVEFYLADFRNNKQTLLKNWQKVDLSALGNIDSINFAVSSSDDMAPSYVCIDNLTFEEKVVK